MNTVIWLMYLADVATSLSVVLCVGAGLTFLAVGFYKFASHIEEFDAKPVKSYVIGAAAAVGIATLIPSQNTIYAAAAVAAGQKALETPTGDKAIRALNAWLDRQIADDGSKK